MIKLLYVVPVLSLAVVATDAQSTVSGVFFNEGWESGSVTNSFNSSYYGSARNSQFVLQDLVTANGAFALEHRLPAGLPPSSIGGATQHFGDSIAGPVYPQGQGQHLHDLYIQYKVYYSAGFDFSNNYKQLIIGTQDDRRHENPCCNPWVAHYLTIYVDGSGNQRAEVNNKQAASGQWIGIDPNANGYSRSNWYRLSSGRWYTIEVRRRLNDAGVDNGIFQMWVNGLLIGDHRTIRYRTPWDGTFGSNLAYGTNFVMISDYTLQTVPRDQSIYYDDVKLSTTYIGAGNAPAPPTNLRITQ